MKTILRRLIFSFLILGVVSCKEEDPEINFSSLENEVTNLVNEHRMSLGMNALIVDLVITNECRGHSRNMAEGTVDFSHDGFNDRAERILMEIGGNAAGENVGMGFLTAEAAVEWWLNSPDHKANIEGDFTHTGVGVWQHNGGDFYYTQIFIKK